MSTESVVEKTIACFKQLNVLLSGGVVGVAGVLQTQPDNLPSILFILPGTGMLGMFLSLLRYVLKSSIGCGKFGIS
jgi:hypothetical protein